MRSIKDNKDIKAKLVENIAYLLSSANILPNEPAIYGPLRLIEGAKRIIEFLNDEGLADEELLKIRERINEAISKVLTDEEGFKKDVSEIVKLMADYLKSHYP